MPTRKSIDVGRELGEEISGGLRKGRRVGKADRSFSGIGLSPEAKAKVHGVVEAKTADLQQEQESEPEAVIDIVGGRLSSLPDAPEQKADQQHFESNSGEDREGASHRSELLPTNQGPIHLLHHQQEPQKGAHEH